MSDQKQKIKRIAIFIAISDYTNVDEFKNTDPRLEGIENDVQELAKLILPVFDKVYTFTNEKLRCINILHEPKFAKSFEDIKSFLEELLKELNRKNNSSDHLIWVHFSGHGMSKYNKWILSITGDKYDKDESVVGEKFFSDKYIIDWVNRVFGEDQQRALVTISACQNQPTFMGNSNFACSEEPINDMGNGTCLIGSSPIGHKTIQNVSGLSEFVNIILKSIRSLAKELEGDYITIKDFIDKITNESKIERKEIEVRKISYPGNIYFLERSKLMSVIDGKYDYMLIGVTSDEIQCSYANARISHFWSNDLRKDKLSGIVSRFKTDPSLPLLIYWRGKMRSVGFHLYLNEKESISLNEFVNIIQQTRTSNIAIWIESEQAIRCDAERLALALPGSYAIIAKGRNFQELRKHHQWVIEQIEAGQQDLGTILFTNQNNVIIESKTHT